MAMQGAELRRIRKGMKLTLAELGEALGLSGNFIGMMERGEKAIEKRTELAVLYLDQNGVPKGDGDERD